MTPLPPRLARVLDLLTQGRTPAEIAAELGVREDSAARYCRGVRTRMMRWQQAQEQWRQDFLAISEPDP